MEKKELAITIAKDILVELVNGGKLALAVSPAADKNVPACGDALEALSKRVLVIINSLKG